MKKNTARKVVCGVLSCALTLQPVFASTYQYNVHVKGFQGAATATGPGIGAVNPGANTPTGEGDATAVNAPQLALSSSSLIFALPNGAGPKTKQTILFNAGKAPASVGGIKSDSNFEVSSNCPATLAPNDYCTISVTFEQTGQGAVSYQMPLYSPGALVPVTLRMSSVVPDPAQPHPLLEATPDVVSMGEVNPGQNAEGTATITNIGNMAAQLVGITANEEFAVTSDCPSTLEPMAQCTVTSEFSSYNPGVHSFRLNLVGEDGAVPVPLTFFAKVLSNPTIAPSLSFDKDKLDFGTLAPGETAVQKTVLTNQGNAPATLSPVPTNADFNITSDCGASLSVNSSCQFIVSYTAKAQGGGASYQLTMSAQDGSTAKVLMFSTVPGTTGGTQGVIFSPTSLDLGSLNIGQLSTLSSTLTNKGATAVGLSGVRFDYGAPIFSQTNDCPTTLQPGASCLFSITFKPTYIRNALGLLRVTTADGQEPKLGLSGYGEAAYLGAMPSTVNYGGILRSSTAVTKQVTLANGGNITLTGIQLTPSDGKISVNSGTCVGLLGPLQSCTISISYLPSDFGNIVGSVSVSSSNGGTVPINLSGAVYQLDVSSDALAFSDTPVGQSSAAQVITLSNMGAYTIPFDGISVSAGLADFNQSNNCGAGLAPGASCSVAVAFTPGLEGTRQGTLAVVAFQTVIGTVNLTGFASASNLTLSTHNIRFPDTNVNTTSPVISLVVRNPTTGSVAINGMGIVERGSEFTQSNNCGTVLGAGASCVVNVQVTPLTENGSSGTWAIDSSLGQQTVSLSVQGTTPKVVIPDMPPGTLQSDGYVHYTIQFPDTELNNPSDVRSLTLSNTGTGPLTVSGVSVVAGLSSFGQSNNCGATLAPGKSCTIALLFTPTVTGNVTGGVAINTDNGNFYLDLSGKGTSAIGAWTGVADFGPVLPGQSVDHTFYLKNTGTIAARNIAMNLSGADLSTVSNNCGDASNPGSLAIGASCSITVRYAPAAVGVLSNGVLKATGNFPVSPTLTLTGHAPAPKLAFGAADSGNFGTVTLGSSSSLTFTLQNAGEVTDSLTATPTLTGTGFSRTAGTCLSGSSLDPGATCTITVTATPTQAGTVPGLLSATSKNGATVQLNLSVSGIDPADGKTALLLHMDGSFADYSGKGNSVSSVGSVGVNSLAKFGSGSLAIGTTSSGLVVKGTDFSFPAGTDFTIEAFIYPTGSATYKQIVGQWGTTNAYQLSLFSGKLAWQTPSGVAPQAGTALSYNTWHHVAVTRAGNVTRLFSDGVMVGSVTDNISYPYNQTTGLGVGKVAGQDGYSFGSGYIDEVRVTKGYARYTGNFTAPTSAFTN